MSSPSIVLCAWCPKKHTYRTMGDPKWKPITEHVVEIAKNAHVTGAISHGICPTCVKACEEELELNRSIAQVQQLQEKIRGHETPQGTSELRQDHLLSPNWL